MMMNIYLMMMENEERDFYTVNFHERVISKRNLNLILEKC